MPSLPVMVRGTNIIMSPHVVVLGAGASKAAFPNGDKYGLKLPLMNDFVETVGLEKLLSSKNISYKDRNFEEIYDEISASHKGSEFLEEVKNKVHNYFAQLHLPDEITIYDKLILCLRKKDLIASFNWDPLLAMAYSRNTNFPELPEIIFLHGNVAVGVCIKDKMRGFLGTKCIKCDEYLKQTELLYPIKNKEYNKDPYIASEWKILQSYLEKAYFLTIFGYSAPKTDVAAIDMMKRIWEKNQTREIAEIDIIDIKSNNSLAETWKEFIVRSHYFTVNDFNHSYMCSRYPRRTCEGLFMATMQNQPWRDNPLPKVETLQELHDWISPLIKEEIKVRKEQISFSGLPRDELV